eukprot:GHVT01101947.1.p1 GENE.GHVT01101947.1~~GHVT01101947.1.p1  ORF type:complete len:365 (+),score=51.94 GHVT01101947.1:634-1728(+)
MQEQDTHTTRGQGESSHRTGKNKHRSNQPPQTTQEEMWYFWIDCDSFFMDNKRSLVDLLKFYLPKHRNMASPDLVISEDGTLLNSGVFFLRQSAWSLGLLEWLWGGAVAEVWVEHPWWENAAIVWYLLGDLHRHELVITGVSSPGSLSRLERSPSEAGAVDETSDRPSVIASLPTVFNQGLGPILTAAASRRFSAFKPLACDSGAAQTPSEATGFPNAVPLSVTDPTGEAASQRQHAECASRTIRSNGAQLQGPDDLFDFSASQRLRPALEMANLIDEEVGPCALKFEEPIAYAPPYPHNVFLLPQSAINSYHPVVSRLLHHDTFFPSRFILSFSGTGGQLSLPVLQMLYEHYYFAHFLPTAVQ